MLKYYQIVLQLVFQKVRCELRVNLSRFTSSTNKVSIDFNLFEMNLFLFLPILKCKKAINMKKYLLTTLLSGTMASMAFGQVSQGGVPYSFTDNSSEQVKQLNISGLDIQQWRVEEEEAEIEGEAKPYMVARNIDYFINVDDGEFIAHADGTVTWQLEINVPGATALDVFFNQLQLTEGVDLYVYGKTKMQVLGAYNAQSNLPEKNFIAGPIVGDSYTIEINYANAELVSQNNIDIQKIGVYFRGFEEEAKMYGFNEGLSELYDSSAPCNIDANCNISHDGWETSQFENAKNASAKIIIAGNGGMGFCSGTLVASSGYSTNNCKNLFLTASHCDGANGRTDEHFSDWRFYFNYEHTECEGSQIAYQFRSVQGAKFLARSNYPSGVGNTSNQNPGLVQDFIALELNAIPESYNTYKVGWNRRADIASMNADYSHDEYKFFIGFHHPGGNPKKQSIASLIYGNGTFNQFSVPATHWGMTFAQGCTQGGSSGSGLFDQDGNIIGVLSGGSGNTNGLYSKISYGWENTWEQGKFPPYTGAVSRLKDWLDPAGTNQAVFFGTDANCTTVDVKEHENLSESVSVYPNPVTDGRLNVRFNLPRVTPITINVVDVLGKTVHSQQVSGHAAGQVEINLQSFTNGIYFIVSEIEGQQVTKKIVVSN